MLPYEVSWEKLRGHGALIFRDRTIELLYNLYKTNVSDFGIELAMKLNHFNNAVQFYERVNSYLLQYEAHHNLMFGIINTLIRSPERYPHSPYLVTVENDQDETVLAVALRTPPNNLVLSRSRNSQALITIAQDLHSRQEPIPGVIGPVTEAKTFTEAWQMITNQSYRDGMALRIYQLEAVQSIPKANGFFRQATPSDRELLITWYEAFMKEAMNDRFKLDAEHLVDSRLSEGNLYLWQDNVPVSLAGYSGETPNGIRINLVYTPPEYRQKGYASSCVAALSQTLLKQGYNYCFLFTDLANPTSNHIYQTIGYHPVCDVSEYWFNP